MFAGVSSTRPLWVTMVATKSSLITFHGFLGAHLFTRCTSHAFWVGPAPTCTRGIPFRVFSVRSAGGSFRWYISQHSPAFRSLPCFLVFAAQRRKNSAVVLSRIPWESAHLLVFYFVPSLEFVCRLRPRPPVPNLSATPGPTPAPRSRRGGASRAPRVQLSILCRSPPVGGK